MVEDTHEECAQGSALTGWDVTHYYIDTVLSTWFNILLLSRYHKGEQPSEQV